MYLMAVTVVGPRALPGNSQRALCVAYNHLLRHSHPAPPPPASSPPSLPHLPACLIFRSPSTRTTQGGATWPRGWARLDSTLVTRAFSSLVRKQTELILDFIEYLKVRRRFRELLVSDVPCKMFQVAPDRRRSVVQFCPVSLLTVDCSVYI